MISWYITQLKNIEEKTRCIIFKINLNSNVTRQLANLGIIPGVELCVTRNDNNGPTLVEINDNQVMLDSNTVQNIDVKVKS